MARHWDALRVYLVFILATFFLIFYLLHYYDADVKKFEPENENASKIKQSFNERNVMKAKCKEMANGPPVELEETRKHVVQTSREQWFFLRSQIRKLQSILSSTFNLLKCRQILQYMLDHGTDYSNVIGMELKKLASLDSWDEWRREETQLLKTTVQRRIQQLQNPRNCSATAVLVCNLTNENGFASGMHDVLWCLVTAHHERRRLVLETRHWHYTPGGWETLFQPLSERCAGASNGARLASTSRNNNKARWIMRTLPQDLGPRITRIFSDPLAWWYGQFLRYLMRPNERLNSLIEDTLERINFTNPLVGLHVRRTDKIGSEAKSHRLEDYLQHAEDYFLQQDLSALREEKRRVYIATDDPGVLDECKIKFASYECLYHPGSAATALRMETRYSNTSLWSLMIDIFVLARSHFLICTFSSGLCRLAYELKQGINEDPTDVSEHVLSLDIPHHYAWVTPTSRVAIYNHKAKSSKEIPFKTGDVLTYKDEYSTVHAAVKGKSTNGLTQMIHDKTLEKGIIPSYKTKEIFQFTKFSVQDELCTNT